MIKIIYRSLLLILFSFITVCAQNFEVSDYVGFWRGTWFNNTFQSTDSAFIDISANESTNELTMVLDLDGNVFGGTDPDPATMTGTYDNNGFSVTGNSATYGDMFFTGNTNGDFNGRLPDVPNPGIDSTTLTGTYTSTNIDLTYIVYFTGGGTTADGVINLEKDAASDVDFLSSGPETFQLYQNYPNPFNPSTKIQFSIPEQTFVNLTIFDITGRTIDRLVSEVLPAGNYNYTWNAEDLSGGVYFYKISAENFTQTKKLILLK